MIELFIVCMALIFTLYCLVVLTFILHFVDRDTKKEVRKKNEKKDN